MMSESHSSIIQYHDTWVSWDPIKGCLANCAYCYLGPMKLRGVRPQVRIDPAQAIDKLESDPIFQVSDVPIAIGNYTDMFIGQDNREYLINLLTELNSRGHRREICLITKGKLDREFVDRLHRTGQRDLTFFLSQSFSKLTHPRIERGGTAGFGETIENARLIRSVEGWTPIHFWRPFLAVWNRGEDLGYRVAALKEAGMASSVVVGHKRFHNALQSSVEMTNLTDPGRDIGVSGGSEDFFQEGFDQLVQMASALEYDVFRNTSCSLAATRRRPDSHFTFTSEIADTHCRAVSCRPDQRAVCGTAVLRNTELELNRMVEISGVPRDTLRLMSDGRLEVLDQIPESAYNSLRYMAKSPIKHSGLSSTSKVWMGAEIGHSSSGKARELLAESPDKIFSSDFEVLRRIDRLKRVSGFATAFCYDDPRFQVFARYDHIQRVSWVAKKLLAFTSAPEEETLKYVWLHDLNRWAFAHNSEIGNYSQAQDAPRYFDALPETVMRFGHNFKLFHAKVTPGPDIAYATALAADMLTGMLEDPLMLLCGLNVSTDFLAGAEGFAPEFYSSRRRAFELKAVAYALHVERNVDRFRYLFANQFIHAVDSFVSLQTSSGNEITNYITQIAHESGRFKEMILRPKVFPVNNELVSRGSSIRSIVEELKELLGETAVRDMMLEVDDESALERFSNAGIDSTRIEGIKPVLDGVADSLGAAPLVEQS